MAALFTLLYTDIEGSTALNTRIGEAAMREVWDRHDRGSRDLMALWRGREIDRSDGFLALFEHVADAAAFAAAYHQMLAGLPVPVRARAGLHLGPLDLRPTAPADVALGAKPLELVGLGKAVAARLMSLARGEQTLASPDAAAALKAAGWRCHSHGHWRFKGLDAPLEVFEIGDAQSAFVPPPDAEKAERVVWTNGQWISARQVPHNLPAERDSFVGRTPDLHALGLRLRDGARLVTLHGPGGMGKTRLALRYAWAWRGDHPGGLWFCDLAQARSLDGLLQAVASGLDLPLSGDPVAQIGRAIAGRDRCLVILDNFEQVARHAAETLGRWLDAAPSACFIATSREVLGLPGEQTLDLSPLPGGDAVELFHQRAMAAYSGYMPAAVDAGVVARLVDLLDGMPLAIELAAPRVRTMPPEMLLARMGDRFRLLASPQGRPDRQATLRATLEWSWELLSAAEKSALAQMSVFEGGFDWAAAEAVIDLSGCTGALWLQDAVQGLVDKSLVRTDASMRFGLLRSVHDFASAKLVQAGDATLVDMRHGRHFSALDESGAIAGRCADLDNCIRACRGAVGRGDADVATKCLALAWAGLRLTGPLRSAVELADAVLGIPDLDPPHEAAAEWVGGVALGTMGANADAEGRLTRGLAALGQEDEPLLRARLHGALSDAAAGLGDLVQASHHLTLARGYAEQVRNPAMMCRLINAAGSLAERQGHLQAARSQYEAALQIATAAGDDRWRGGLLGNLGALHFAEGRLEEARHSYEAALALAEVTADRRWAANARCNLGLIHQLQGRHAAAEAELNLSLEAARHLGARPLEYAVLCNLGIVLEAAGQLTTAIERYETAVRGAQALDRPRSEAEFRTYLGVALARSGKHAAALDCLARAVELSRTAQDAVQEAASWCAVAEVELHHGDVAAARRALSLSRAVSGSSTSGTAQGLSGRLDALELRLAT